MFGDPDATFMDKVGAAIGLLMLGVIGIYSKAILKYVGALAAKKLLKIGGFTAAVFFSPVVAFVGTVVGLIVAGVAGLISGVEKGKQVYGETGSMSKAIEEGMEKFIAYVIGIVPNLLLDAIGYFVGIFSPKLGAKIKGIDVVQFLDDSIDKIQVIFESIIDKVAVALMAIGDYFTRGAFLPKIEDFEGELKKLESAKERAVDFDTKADLEQQIMKLKRDKQRIDIFEKRQERGGVFKGIGDTESPYSDLGYYRGGGLRKGNLALIGESASGRGGELVYSGSDAMVLNQSRTDQLLTMALEKGLSGGGGESSSPTIITDNSIRSNTSNMISSPSMITSNDSLMNSITNSV